MRRCARLLVGVAIIPVAVGLAALPAQAAVIAGTGFENPPGNYLDNTTVVGYGAGESGWTSNWVMHAAKTSGAAITQDDVKQSDDMALKMSLSGTGGVAVIREYTDQALPLVGLSADMRVDGSIGNLANDGLYLYAGPSSDTWGGSGPDSGTAFMLRLGRSGNIYAFDGVGTGSGGTGKYGFYEDTGFDWTSGSWVHVEALLDLNADTYELWIDGSKYNAPDPLGFRRNTNYVDDVMFYFRNDGSTVPVGYVDNVLVTYVPEPASMLLLASGVLGVLVCPFRRRRKTARCPTANQTPEA